jgi:transcriptional regulator with XRE-family HTH domain
MKTGSVLLAKHLTVSGQSLRDFAAKVGTSASLVSMWRAGKRVPGIEFALKIERATKGRVRLRDWLREVPDEPHAKQRPSKH